MANSEGFVYLLMCTLWMEHDQDKFQDKFKCYWQIYILVSLYSVVNTAGLQYNQTSDRKTVS